MGKLASIALILMVMSLCSCEDSGSSSSSGKKYKWINESSHRVSVTYYQSESEWLKKQGSSFSLLPGEEYKLVVEQSIHGYVYEPRSGVYVDYRGDTGLIFRNR